MIEQAKLELLQTHSAIPILVQLAEQVFKLLEKSALGIGSEAAPKQPRMPRPGPAPTPPSRRLAIQALASWLGLVKSICLVSFHPAEHPASPKHPPESAVRESAGQWDMYVWDTCVRNPSGLGSARRGPSHHTTPSSLGPEGGKG